MIYAVKMLNQILILTISEDTSNHSITEGTDNSLVGFEGTSNSVSKNRSYPILITNSLPSDVDSILIDGLNDSPIAMLKICQTALMCVMNTSHSTAIVQIYTFLVIICLQI